MNTWRFPAFVMAALYMGLLAFVSQSTALLPARLATHFNGAGEPNGWLAMGDYLKFIAMFGTVLPLLWVVLPQLFRFLPVSVINLPNREYWLVGPRRAEALAYLVRHFLWFGCLQVGLAGGIHYAVYRANLTSPVRLPGLFMWVIIGGFFVAALAWTAVFWRHFQKTEPAAKAN